MQQQSSQMMQHQHQHQQNQLQQQQQQHSNQTGSHMRTAQAAASQYPMGYPYPAGGMDNGQGLAQGQPMVGGEMQHFNMQQNPAGAVAGAQRQMINVAQLNPMLAGEANGSTNQPDDIPPLPPSSLIALLTIYSLLPLVLSSVSYTHHLHPSPSFS